MSLKRATGLLGAAILVLAASAAAAQGNGRLAYMSHGSIYTVDPTGGAPTLLHEGYYPSFSPDGTRVAFDSGTVQSGFSIVVLEADGSGATTLALDASQDALPSWSPDGTKLAFTTTSDSDIAVASA